MENIGLFTSNKPIALVFADPESFPVYLSKSFSKKGCLVVIVSRDDNKWHELFVKHGLDDSEVSLINYERYKEICSQENSKRDYLSNVNYAVYVDVFSKERKYTKKFSLIKEFVDEVFILSENAYIKSLFVVSYEKNDDAQKKLVTYIRSQVRAKEGSSIAFLGHPVNRNSKLNEIGVIGDVIGDFVKGRGLAYSNGKSYGYLTDAKMASDAVIKLLFSFGVPQKEVAVVSQPISLDEIVVELEKIFQRGISNSTRNQVTGFYECSSTVTLQVDIKKILKELVAGFQQGTDKKKVTRKKNFKLKKLRFSKISLNKRSFRPRALKLEPGSLIKYLIISALLLLVFSPFLSLLLSVGSLLYAKEKVVSGNVISSKRFVNISRKTSMYSKKMLVVYNRIPVVGVLFKQPLKYSDLLLKTSNLASKGVLLTEKLVGLGNSILGEEPYDVSMKTEEIALDLDYLYKNIGFIQTEMDSLSNGKGSIIDKFSYEDISEFRNKLISMRKVVNELPEVLGDDARKEYLILFQNNMEIRPTGGFIGSFALVSFDKGRLVNINVYDVYSADGQLKGHVEPPEPIKRYLGEANWFLRDSNWDPDFRTSAQRAEWFLDKEIDVTVDGVIAIDLEVVKLLLKELGAIYLDDFNQTVDYNNIYEVTQYEVERDFFPGSHKKKNFLTALVRELLISVTDIHHDKYLAAINGMLENLDERHVQIFIHNKIVQDEVEKLGWDGSVNISGCDGNCISDYLGIVEANVGVNKANYFVKRSAMLEVSFYKVEDDSNYAFEDDSKSCGNCVVVKRQLSILLENDSVGRSGSGDNYKDYLRVIMPKDSKIDNVVVIDKKTLLEEIYEPEVEYIRGRQEVGILVDIPFGQAKSVIYNWDELVDINFEEPGEYRLYWRKQAGILDDPISVKVYVPEGLRVQGFPQFSLTSQDSVGYNSNLSRDFISRITW